MANAAVSQTIDKEDLAKQLELKHKRPDGGASRKRPFNELSAEEKFQNIDVRLNGLRKDINQSSFRVYGIQQIPQKQFSAEELSSGAQARKMYVHEVLEDIFIKALGIDPNVARVMTTSGLADVFRFRESGTARQYCVVFKLNRSELCGHVFKNLSKLGNYQNPYGQRQLTISRNLSEEENRERQKCLAVKDILKARGFDPKIKKNIFLSVNGAEPRHYSTFVEEDSTAATKRPRLEQTQQVPITSETRQDAWGINTGESSTSGKQGSESVNKSVIGPEYPPLPRTDDLTPEQLNKVRGYIDTVRASAASK